MSCVIFFPNEKTETMYFFSNEKMGTMYTWQTTQYLCSENLEFSLKNLIFSKLNFSPPSTFL